MGCCNCKEGTEFLFSPRTGKTISNDKISFKADGTFSFSDSKIQNNSQNNPFNNNNTNISFISKKISLKNEPSISDRTNNMLIKEDKENLRYHNVKTNNFGDSLNKDIVEISPSSIAKRLVNNLNINAEKNNNYTLKEQSKIEDEDNKNHDNFSSKREFKKNTETTKNSQIEVKNRILKDDYDKAIQSRNDKYMSDDKNKNFSNNATILSIADNNIPIKDITLDSNIMSTNRDYLLREKIKQMNLNSINESQAKNLTTSKKIIPNETITDDSVQQNVINQMNANNSDKKKSLSEIESKRAKFMEKMNGLKKTSVQDSAQKIEKENINTADTTNPPEIKKSFNINALIKNLENHRKGSTEIQDKKEYKIENYVNIILEKPLSKLHKNKLKRPDFK